LPYIIVKPDQLFTDRGTNYRSSSFHEVLTILDVQHNVPPAHHQATNGEAERFIASLKSKIMTAQAQTNSDWADSLLPLIVFNLNTTVSSVTGYSPFYLMHGRDPRLLADSTFTARLPLFADPNVYSVQLTRSIRYLWENNTVKIASHTDLTRLNYNESLRPSLPIVPGSLVLLKNDGPQQPLAAKWKGPYRVLSLTDSTAQVSQLAAPTRIDTVHKSRIKLYNLRQPVSLTPPTPSTSTLPLAPATRRSARLLARQ
jgi:hypothetical protein